jgi:hypothetical protein
MALCDSRGRAPEDQVLPASVAACLMDCICFVCLQLACMWACIEGMRDSSAFIQTSLSVLHEALCKFL